MNRIIHHTILPFYGTPLNYQLSKVRLKQDRVTVGDRQLWVQEEQSRESEIAHALEYVDVLQLEGHTFAQDVSTLGGDTMALRRIGPTSAVALSGAPSDGQVAYLHTDHLGSVVKATDENQAIIWDIWRKPFGSRVITTKQVTIPLGFPGQYYDKESRNYYNYFRDYDPSTGRYLQSDPIGLGGGLNTYVYVSANPNKFIDPMGLFELYGYQNRGSGQGWHSQFEFNFNPISEAPGDIIQKINKGAKWLEKAVDFINVDPVGPLHPYKDYLQCALLDKDLEDDFEKRFNNDRLSREDALDYLNDMWNKYPEMRERYPSPQNMVNTAEQSSRDNWFYKLRPDW